VLEEQQTIPLAKVLGDGGDGPARNAMVQCLIAGMIMQRYIYALEPARCLPAAQFEAVFAACLQQAIGGPLEAGGRWRAAAARDPGPGRAAPRTVSGPAGPAPNGPPR
jgi:hypothetical protein